METPAAPSPLDLRQFVVKERVGFLKLTDTYDLLDPATQKPVALAREVPGALNTVLRLVVNKHFLPTTVKVSAGENGPPLFQIRKPFTFLRSKVAVLDGQDAPMGYFKSKLFSLGGGFWVFDNKDQQFAEVKGDWKGWNFRFLGSNGVEMGTVTKKWAGLGKELFTSADTYIVSLSESLAGKRSATILLVAAALAIDIVFKENKG